MFAATTAPLAKAITKAEKMTTAFSGKVSKFLAGPSGIGGAIGGALAGVTVAAGVKYAISAFSEIEQAQTKLQGAIRLSGNTAGVTMQQIGSMAKTLSQTTTIGTAGATNMAAALMKMGQIKGPNFAEAMKQSANLAAVMGTEGPEAAAKLAAALRNPAEGYLELAKDGVAFSESQIDQIQAMQAAGDMAGAQAVLLAALKSQMDGAAEAAGETFAGQMSILQNSFDNLAAIVGEAVMPAIKYATTALSAWVQSCDTAQNKASVFSFVAQSLGVVVDTVQVLQIAWQAAKVSMAALIYAGVEGFRWLVEGINWCVKGAESLGWISKGTAKGMESFTNDCRNFASAMRQEVGDEFKQLGKQLDAPWKSNTVVPEIKKTQAVMQEAAKEMGKAIKAGPVAGMKQLTARQIEAQGEATKLIRDLEEQNKFFGQANYEQTASKLKDKGATTKQVDQVRKLGAQLEGKQLKQSLENPLEKFQREMAKLEKLRADGGVDQDTYQRQKNKLTKDFASAVPQEKASAGGAMSAFSTEARSAVLNYRNASRNANPQIAIQKIVGQQLEETKRTNQYLAKMADKKAPEHAPMI